MATEVGKVIEEVALEWSWVQQTIKKSMSKVCTGGLEAYFLQCAQGKSGYASAPGKQSDPTPVQGEPATQCPSCFRGRCRLHGSRGRRCLPQAAMETGQNPVCFVDSLLQAGQQPESSESQTEIASAQVADAASNMMFTV